MSKSKLIQSECYSLALAEFCWWVYPTFKDFFEVRILRLDDDFWQFLTLLYFLIGGKSRCVSWVQQAVIYF